MYEQAEGTAGQFTFMVTCLGKKKGQEMNPSWSTENVFFHLRLGLPQGKVGGERRWGSRGQGYLHFLPPWALAHLICFDKESETLLSNKNAVAIIRTS